jgi:hypothetical protein
MRSLDFSGEELLEVFRAVWFDMKLDYAQFSLLGQSNRSCDAVRFMDQQRVRFSVLEKVFPEVSGRSGVSVEFEQAKEVMLFVGGLKNGCGGTATEIARNSRGD